MDDGIFLNENKKSLPLTIGTGFLEEVFILNVLYFHSTSSFPFSYDFLPNLLAIEDETGNNLIIKYPNALSKNHYKLSFIPPKKGKVIIKSMKLPKLQIMHGAQIKINVR